MHSELSQLEDAALVLLGTLGSIPAFDELIRRYRGAIGLVAEQIVKNRSVAEDIVQETFLAAFRALPQLEEPAAFPAWLRAIARNQAIRVLKQERKCTTVDNLEQVIHANSQEIRPRDWVSSLEHEVVYRAIAQLPEDQQEVLYLAAYEDWSIAQIAQYLAVPEATVRGRLYRARQSVRQYYYQEEIK